MMRRPALITFALLSGCFALAVMVEPQLGRPGIDLLENVIEAQGRQAGKPRLGGSVRVVSGEADDLVVPLCRQLHINR